MQKNQDIQCHEACTHRTDGIQRISKDQLVFHPRMKNQLVFADTLNTIGSMRASFMALDVLIFLHDNIGP